MGDVVEAMRLGGAPELDFRGFGGHLDQFEQPAEPLAVQVRRQRGEVVPLLDVVDSLGFVRTLIDLGEVTAGQLLRRPHHHPEQRADDAIYSVRGREEPDRELHHA